jgi:hypothetical protein
MYLCMSVCMCMCVWASSECVVSQVSAQVCMCAHVQVCVIYVCMYALRVCVKCVCVCMYLYMSVCLCMCMFVCVCLCLCVCVCVCERECGCGCVGAIVLTVASFSEVGTMYRLIIKGLLCSLYFHLDFFCQLSCFDAVPFIIFSPHLQSHSTFAHAHTHRLTPMTYTHTHMHTHPQTPTQTHTAHTHTHSTPSHTNTHTLSAHSHANTGTLPSPPAATPCCWPPSSLTQTSSLTHHLSHKHRYFALTTGCNAVLLASIILPLATSQHVPLHQLSLTPSTTSACAVLGVGLLCSAGNFLLIEPKATTLMFQRCGGLRVGVGVCVFLCVCVCARMYVSDLYVCV